jgi:hypothetical protein
MKRALMGILLALWVIAGALPARGQGYVFGDVHSACDGAILDAIEEASPHVDYHAACEQFLACTAAGREINVCQFEVAGRLLELCEVDDVPCRNEALLHVAALTIYGPLWDYRNIFGCLWDIGGQFPELLHLFSAGSYNEAAGVFDQLRNAQERFCVQPMHSYIDGLIDEARGLATSSLQLYADSVESSELNPTPALYSYGMLLGQLGHIFEASIAGEQLRRFLTATAPEVLPSMSLLLEQYPLDRSAFTSWIAYPVAISSGGNNFAGLQDLTLEPGIPITIGQYADQLVILDFPTARTTSPTESMAQSLTRTPAKRYWATV